MSGQSCFNGEPPTLRDYFAAAALPSVMDDYANVGTLHHGRFYLVAEDAYRMADAMLAQKRKDERPQ